MNTRTRSSHRLLLLSFGFLATAVVWSGCGKSASTLDPESEAYREVVSTFYSSIAALQVGADQRAEANLAWLTENVPDEPAVWANLAVLHLRHSEPEKALDPINRAIRLAPDHSGIRLISGAVLLSLDRREEALEAMHRAVSADTTNVRALFTLAQTIELEPTETASEEIASLLSRILSLRPDNVAARIQAARLAARMGDTARTITLLRQLADQSIAWPEQALERLSEILTSDPPPAPDQLTLQVSILQNVMLRSPAYRQSLAQLQTPVEEAADLLTRFVVVPSPPTRPAPADDSLAFSPMPPVAAEASWNAAVAAPLQGDGPPAVVVGNGAEVRILGGMMVTSAADAQGTSESRVPFPGRAALAPSRRALRLADANYDFRLDLAMAGPGGFRLFLQDSAGGFHDATPTLGLPSGVLNAPYHAVWSADLDLEGDLDFIVAPEAGAPVRLRNNGDGSFAAEPVFETADGVRDFAWADFDADGDPDAAATDARRRLVIFLNQRGGRFEPAPVALSGAGALAVTAADLDRDGVVDLAALLDDGRLVRIDPATASPAETLGAWDGLDATADLPGRLISADLDNNGGVDLIASAGGSTRIWLRNPDDTLSPLPVSVDGFTTMAIDLSGDGSLDLLTLREDGSLQRLVNQSVRDYHWKEVRPRAASVSGDQRINSFGIGGEIEVRAGLLYQKQPITEPVVHFGMGDQLIADVTRIVWPNGSVQAEFDLLSDVVVSAQQRLKGSCPWLFTFDGEKMGFVTDFIWRSPLGLKVNAQETAGVMTTLDWVKIRGDQLAPRDGLYDVRVTAELWETHFFDLVNLLVVDHPVDTEVFVDERFVFPPPKLELKVTSAPKPVRRVLTDTGEDATDLLATRDGRYLDFFGRGAYQGITRSHFIEIDLGDDAPIGEPLVLIGHGWIRPTDSSINVAIGQGSAVAPSGLRLEAPDGRGGWRVVHENLGFPSGKSKTVLLDLTDAFLDASDSRIRLSTNLEIYWDDFAWARPRPEAEIDTLRLGPQSASLRYRGFSQVTEADRSSPELPSYSRLAGTSQLWRDLDGYYTRYGPVDELVGAIDDRYVIMNAGDELLFRFRALSDPKPGMKRDFVLVGDGWVKDGDFNTSFSKTVLPLPSHADAAYDRPPTVLEDDPVYRRFPEDWVRFHTRYVSPERFSRTLVP